jgi:uncharacterized protein (UPF0210 family)
MNYSVSEDEVLTAFAHELALVLRRLTGRDLPVCESDLPRPVSSDEQMGALIEQGAVNG